MLRAAPRYAYAQARIRGRLARLPAPRLGELAAAGADAVRQDLAPLGWDDPAAAILEALERVLRMLEGAPRAVVLRYRARYECENLKVLLRGLERGAPYAEVAPLLLPVGALGPGALAAELLAAGSLAEALARLDPHPFGRSLRRLLRSAGSGERMRLEALAEREAYEAVWQELAALDGADRRAAVRVVGLKLDCLNCSRALRLRTAHRLSPEEVLAYAIRGGRFLGARERAVLAHEPVESWPEQLAATPLAGPLARAEAPWAVERELGRLLAAQARRELARPPFSLGLVLAYLVLVELVGADAQRVLEGRRLGRSEAWIRAGLVTGRAH